MKKFTNGMIAGGLLGAVGISALLSSKSSRNKVMKNGKKMVNDAQDVMDDVKNKMW